MMAVLALAAESALAVAALRLRMPPVLVLGCHASIAGVLSVWVWSRWRTGADTTSAMLLVIAALAAGPAGALAALIFAPFSGRGGRGEALLEAWYRRIALSAEIDETTRLCDNVETGRTIDAAAPAPRSFTAVIANGTLAERQTALGLMARKFHPDYAPALRAALMSPEPVIRVQAAAVAARVRTELTERARAMLDRLSEEGPKPPALGSARELQACVSSGLLDEGTRKRATEAAAGLLATATAESAIGLDGDPDERRPWRVHVAAEARLLREGRFAEFRALRRQQHLAARGSFRLRRIGRHHRQAPAVDGGGLQC